MKVGIVITNHFSKYRKTGRKFLYQLLESIKNSLEIEEYKIYIIDNGSIDNIKRDFEGDDKIFYHYIKDQSIGGITYAWNLGVKRSIKDNCDIVLNLNDDLIINKTINIFISSIYNHPHKNISLFGPMTSIGGGPNHQIFSKNKHEIIETTGLDYGDESIKKLLGGYPLNGFALGFTRECYYNFNEDGWFFSRDVRDAWSNQETEFYVRNKPKGLKNYIVQKCFITHYKAFTYKRAREVHKGEKRTVHDYSELKMCQCYL